MKRFAIIALFSLISGCGVPIEVAAPFDKNEVAYIHQQGSATLTGQAFLRQNGGGVVTCAGSKVALLPAGAYTKEFVTKAFGNVQGGKVNALQVSQINHPDGFTKQRRETICDAEGDFEFKNVANGDYYVASIVTWNVGGSIIPEGGGLIKFVRISGGRSQRLLLN